MRSFDVQVAGSGIVGKTLALALARLGLSVALRGAAVQGRGREDVRAYALNAGSVALLRGLKVWDALPEDARTTVHDMLVHGDAAGAALEFSAWEQRVGRVAVDEHVVDGRARVLGQRVPDLEAAQQRDREAEPGQREREGLADDPAAGDLHVEGRHRIDCRERSRDNRRLPPSQTSS